MFERFTDRARRVIVLAQVEARNLHHNYIGTEHLLLGISQQGDGEGVALLKTHGISDDRLRSKIEEIAGRGQDEPIPPFPFTSRVKEVFELSLRDALQMRHEFIAPEHLLLGILREGEGVAVQVISALGVDPRRLKAEVLALLQTEAEGSVAAGFQGGTVGGDEPSEIGDPRCPGCRARLIESASYRILEVAEHGGEGHRRVLFLFCLRCGLAIDNEILPEDE